MSKRRGAVAWGWSCCGGRITLVPVRRWRPVSVLELAGCPCRAVVGYPRSCQEEAMTELLIGYARVSTDGQDLTA